MREYVIKQGKYTPSLLGSVLNSLLSIRPYYWLKKRKLVADFELTESCFLPNDWPAEARIDLGLKMPGINLQAWRASNRNSALVAVRPGDDQDDEFDVTGFSNQSDRPSGFVIGQETTPDGNDPVDIMATVRPGDIVRYEMSFPEKDRILVKIALNPFSSPAPSFIEAEYTYPVKMNLARLTSPWFEILINATGQRLAAPHDMMFFMDTRYVKI